MAGVSPSSQGEAASAKLPLLLACPLAAADEPRIRDAMRGHADVRFVSSVADLPGAVAEDHARLRGVLVAATDRHGHDGVPVVRRLVTEFPDVPVVGHCHAGIEHSGGLRALVLAGAHAYLFAGIDDCGIALRTVFDTARRQCVGELVLDRLLPVVPQRLHPFVEACLLDPQQATTVATVARMLSVTRKTLFNHCDRERFPAPAELIMWCRLMLAAWMLEHTTRTVLSVALELEFASDTSLRNLFKRYVAATATGIRRGGGLGLVLERFHERCTAVRAGERTRELPLV